jgi:hypothetical protein
VTSPNRPASRTEPLVDIRTTTAIARLVLVLSETQAVLAQLEDVLAAYHQATAATEHNLLTATGDVVATSVVPLTWSTSTSTACEI